MYVCISVRTSQELEGSKQPSKRQGLNHSGISWTPSEAMWREALPLAAPAKVGFDYALRPSLGQDDGSRWPL